MKLPATFSAFSGAVSFAGEITVPDGTLAAPPVQIAPAPAPSPLPVLIPAPNPAPNPAPLPVALEPLPMVLPPRMFTDAHPYNQPCNTMPAETRSFLQADLSFIDIAKNFMEVFGPNHIHFDNSMPVTIVDSGLHPEIVAPVTITTNWGSDDEGPGLPIRGDAVEGNVVTDVNGDRHVIVYDVRTGKLHELFNVSILKDGVPSSDPTGDYSAQAYRRWNPAIADVGSLGQNSAAADGCSILQCLTRFGEAKAGPIRHALRLTINLTRGNPNGGAFCLPACHASGDNYGTTAYEGMRMYLHPDYLQPAILAALPNAIRNIVVCLMTYGLVVQDNGGSGYMTCDNDPGWDTVYDTFNQLGIRLSDFVVVNSGPITDASGQVLSIATNVGQVQ